MIRLRAWLRQIWAATRALAVLTALTGVVYPLAVTGLAQFLFHHQANGSPLVRQGRTVGSELIGQNFPESGYFQSRPSVAGKDGYDTLASAASNLGPEDVLDRPGRPSLLSQVCARSVAVGRREGVSGARPYCADGGGAVVKVFPNRVVSANQPCPATPFVATYEGTRVECARPGEDLAAGRTAPVRGTARAVVPVDAVTASGSGLDPDISVAYAELQAPRVARERGLDLARVRALIRANTTGRTLGFLGEPAVNVLRLNLALDGR